MIKRTITDVYIDYVELDEFCHDLCIITDKMGYDQNNGSFTYVPPAVRDEDFHDNTLKTGLDPYDFTIICVYELSEEERMTCEWCPELPVLYSASPDLPIQFKDKTAREMIRLFLTDLDSITDSTMENY